MNKSLLILNHPFFLDECHHLYQNIAYAPLFFSSLQKDFLKKRYLSIKRKYPLVSWTEEVFETQNMDVIAWHSHNEQKVFKKNLLPLKNRLFDTIPFAVGEIFTPFKNQAEKFLPKYYPNAIKPFDQEVLDELHYYFKEKKLALNYFETRNGLVGRDFSTKFSSFLSSGSLDVRYLYNQVKDFEQENTSNKSTYWIIFELLWREFFYWHYQKHTHRYFSENGLTGPLDFSEFAIYSYEDLKKLKLNRFMLAALNELESTGFLSNRVRQIFASIWLNDLKLNWRSGAKYFEQRLIDYDVFSNYGNWMYLAGVGVDPRGKRYFNLEKQLKTYDPENKYINKWFN